MRNPNEIMIFGKDTDTYLLLCSIIGWGNTFEKLQGCFKIHSVYYQSFLENENEFLQNYNLAKKIYKNDDYNLEDTLTNYISTKLTRQINPNSSLNCFILKNNIWYFCVSHDTTLIPINGEIKHAPRTN